jgi:hypothetical protein
MSPVLMVLMNPTLMTWLMMLVGAVRCTMVHSDLGSGCRPLGIDIGEVRLAAHTRGYSG